jgi:hypothetical protein
MPSRLASAMIGCIRVGELRFGPFGTTDLAAQRSRWSRCIRILRTLQGEAILPPYSKWVRRKPDYSSGDRLRLAFSESLVGSSNFLSFRWLLSVQTGQSSR